MLFLVLFTISSLQLLVNADTDQDNSPHWVDICGGSYLFSEDTKNWNDASDMCLLLGSHLLQIDNLTENYCLLEYAHKQGIDSDVGWWHSGNDIEAEGVWRQADGELILWTPYWGDYGSDHSHQPDQGTAANCLGFTLSTDRNAGKWFDGPCSVLHYYICERS